MRNFIVTIDGKSYSVGVEEVGESENENRDMGKTPVAGEAKPKLSAVGQNVLSPVRV